MATATKEKKYIEAVGRRKTAVARVRLFEDKKTSFLINNKTLDVYFPTQEMKTLIQKVFDASNLDTKFMVSAHIQGGGSVAQSEALRHGIARALVHYDENLRKTLKKAGYLKRDPRSKERKKFGLKKARKAAQWSKR